VKVNQEKLQFLSIKKGIQPHALAGDTIVFLDFDYFL
jgi:hypothetical protein